MSEFKGTPGPWKLRSHEIQSVGSDGSMTAICYGIANANLIAAAPELLEALNEMVESYEHEASMSNPALLQARAAIAKALGQ